MIDRKVKSSKLNVHFGEFQGYGQTFLSMIFYAYFAGILTFSQKKKGKNVQEIHIRLAQIYIEKFKPKEAIGPFVKWCTSSC